MCDRENVCRGYSFSDSSEEMRVNSECNVDSFLGETIGDEFSSDEKPAWNNA
jgi:hypothetical protein